VLRLLAFNVMKFCAIHFDDVWLVGDYQRRAEVELGELRVKGSSLLK